MSPADLLGLAGLQATFLPADPPRRSEVAFWLDPRIDADLPGVHESLTVVLPVGNQVRRRDVGVFRFPIGEVLDELLLVEAHDQVEPSVRAWSVAARIAVELVARGRLLPTITPDGFDAWRLGPLDPADLDRRRKLAGALPASAFAHPLPDRMPLTLPSPELLVAAFGDAIADVLPRSVAASLVAGHEPFAVLEPISVQSESAWLEAVHSGTDTLVITLRLELPPGPEELFEASLVLQSPDDASLIIPAADLWDAPEVVLSRFGDVETTLLLALRRAERAWPPAGRFLLEARPNRLQLTDEETDELLGPASDYLAAAGIGVQWPAELLESVEVRPTISTPTPEGGVPSQFSFENLLELRWQASLNGEVLTVEELELLAEAKRSVVRLRGRWVRADPDRLARLRERHTIGAGAALAVALGGELVIDGETVEATIEGPLAELGSRLAGLDLERTLPEPPGLEATLRPYQRRGLAWLKEMADLGLGGVLADDMGLGKTIQVIALHLLCGASEDPPAARRPTLVVCPATLVANWERETARFAPSIPVRRYHGATRQLDDLADDEVVVTTYGVVRRDAQELAEQSWGLVVADEAQAVKNPHTRSSRSLRRIPAGARFALTGTPVENQLSELWALCDWTTPGLLGPLARFQREVAGPIERHQDPEKTAWLSTIVRPFLLRRRKIDPGIAPELPPKTETDRFVPLSGEQATLYRALVTDVMEQIAEAEGMARRGLVLKLLTGLKQICNHPAHFLDQSGPLQRRSGKLDAVTELLDVVCEEGDRALVFTQYVVMGRLLTEHLRARGLRVEILHGRLSLGARQQLVDAMQAGELDVLVLSLKAGGTGLNLTEATHVVHYDRWWNPAVEDQASDRAWRIGQDRPVQVHRMVCEGTVEDRIAALLESKRNLADSVVGSGEAWVSELSNEDLADLVALSASAGID